MRYLFWVPSLMLVGLLMLIQSCAPTQKVEREGYKPLPDSLGHRDYSRKWEKLDQYHSEGKYRSALKVARKIHKKAKKNQNPVQQVKALNAMHKQRLEFAEEPILKQINQIKKDLRTTYFPVGPLLQSLLAEQFKAYYKVNRFEIKNRSIKAKPDSSIKKWSPRVFRDTVHHYFTKSLKPKNKLENYHLASFKNVLKGDTDYRHLRPSLFDLLSYRAVNHFKHNELAKDFSPQKLLIQDTNYFSPAQQFMKAKLPDKQKQAPNYQILRTFQDLLQIHAEDSAYGPLIHADLERLQAIYQQATGMANKRQAYYKSLKRVIENYPDTPPKADAYYLQAKLVNKGFKPEDYPDIPPKQIALQICSKAMEQYPGSIGAQNCKALAKRIRAASFSIKLEKTYLPREPGKFLLSYKNLDSIYYWIIPLGQKEYLRFQEKGAVNLLESLKKKDFLFHLKKDLRLPLDYKQHQTELGIPALDKGNYAILLADNPTRNPENDLLAAKFFQVTSLNLINTSVSSKPGEFFVPNAKTGSPVKNVTVKLWEQTNQNPPEFSLKQQTKTDKKGHFSFNARNSRTYIELIKGNDTFFPNRSFFINKLRKNDRTHKQIHFFTDRSIYRPGQKVHFKGILVESKKNGKQNDLQARTSVEVQLVDANNQTVRKKTFQTNSFGSFSGKFDLPQSGLTGYYRLRTRYGSQSISVEEYKRPNFEIELPDIKSAYQLNEQVEFKGKAKSYSGVPLDEASVQYSVKRQVRFPFWYWWGALPSASEKLITKGTTNTEKDGNFRFIFKTKPDPSIETKFKPVFRYKVKVTVTDLTGESHEAEKVIKAGYQAFYPEIKAPEWVNRKEGLSLTPGVRNINGDTVGKSGKLTISRLKSPDKLFRKQLWSSPDLPLEDRKGYKAKYPHDPYKKEHKPQNWDEKTVLFEETVAGNNKLTIKPEDLEGLKPGYYKSRFSIKGKNGKVTKTRQIIKVYEEKGKSAVIPEFSYLIPVKTKAEPGESAELIWGSADKTAHATVHIEQNGEVLEKRHLKVIDSQKKITIPIKEKHRGNIHVYLFSVNENRIYTHHEMIKVPWKNKKLSMHLSTFRSKLRPGKDETWSITLSNADGKPANAELLASMYDASLDAIKKHGWSFNLFPTFRPRLNYNPINSFSSYGGYFQRFSRSRNTPEFKEYRFEQLIGEPFNRTDKIYLSIDKSKGSEIVTMAKNTKPDQKRKKETREKESSKSESKEADLRKDLSETAFFFPQVKTNNSGVVKLNFQTPESLTRWKAMFLAHDQALANAYQTQTVVTQKELMVEPNVPRFLREGDVLEFSVKVSNLSDKALNGPVKLTIIEASNREKLNEVIQGKAKKQFSLKENRSTSISWKINAPENKKGLIYQVQATSDNHSDGQEGLIPVLPAKKMVTESLPLWVKGNNSRSFSFDRMGKEQSSTLENRKVILEMASNPSWYAVQALPSLMKPDYECSEQVFNAFYSNGLAKHILQSNPKMKSVFNKWKNDSSALMSNLKKDQNLKSANLQNTPWLEEAQDEAARKARLAEYFNTSKTEKLLEKNLRKLRNWQLPNGAWPWFKGMNASQTITQTIVGGIGHMDKLGVKNAQSLLNSDMLENALNYMDKAIRKDYERVKQNSDSLEANHLSAQQVQYLYARSFFKDQAIAQKEAFEYWMKQARKYWLSRSIMEQAMLALALHRFGSPDEAKQILTSLKEKSLKDEELGMYWRDNKPGYQWYRSPIEAQAILIEAFSEILNDQDAVQSMKVWLLKQKQVQAWPTTKATAKACYSLLLKGEDWLSGSGDLTIKLNKKPLSLPDEKQAGTGYFRMTWDRKAIKPAKFNAIQIKKSGKGIAWGALHWQYFERLDRISSYETPLKVEKKLYKKVTTEAGETLIPLEKGDSLRPGDYITVRLNLKTDRAMEFIHLQDMRAPALEPLNQLSGYRYQQGLGYYQSIKDATANFFFNRIPKGSHVFEYQLVVSQSGTFQNGIGTVQSMYAPEFNSHSEGRMLQIK